MSIVSSKIIKSRDKGNGRLAVFEQHTDDKGKVHGHWYSCPVGHDIEKELLNWVPKLEATLTEQVEADAEQLQRNSLIDAKMVEVEAEMLLWEAARIDIVEAKK